MRGSNQTFAIEVEGTDKRCPTGGVIGERNLSEGKIPVLSCEGGCIRGEIARLAANMVAQNKEYGRGCHGELLTVPDSGISKWIKNSEKVVLIDGCFLACHGRILENLIDEEKLVHFDALSHYKRYQNLFDIDSVSEDERREVARDVADWVLASI